MANPKIPKGYKGHYLKNADGSQTLVAVTTKTDLKGASDMAKDTAKPAANGGKSYGNRREFVPTFRKYDDMTEGEQAAFRQGAKTNENKVKERLGFLPPRKAKPKN